MTKIEETIDVEVPLHTAYNQWTQFEQFPRFMEGIKEVRQIDDAHLHWVAEIEGKTVEWDSELVQQVPDQVIAWHTVSGAFNSGAARFTSLDEGRTRIVLEMSTDSPRDGGGTPPDHEQASTRARGDLQRFKVMIEGQGSESGTWRGEIQGAQVVGSNGAGGSQPQVESAAAGSQAAAASDQASSAASQPAAATSQTSASGSSLQADATSAARAMSSSARNWLAQMISMWEEPLTMMRRMSEEMDRMVERYIGRPPGYTPATLAAQWTPSVEILQTGDQLMIAAGLPGMSKEDVSIEIRDDKLFIEGQRQESSTAGEQSSRRSTRRFGRFYRMVALPPGIDADRAQATMEHGVLQVTLPVTSVQNRGRRLEIQQAQTGMPTLEAQSQQPQQPQEQQQTDHQAHDTMQTPATPTPQPPSQPSLH